MPDPQAALLHVSPQQQDIFEHIVRRTTSAQRLVKRSRIILLAITGIPNTQIAQQVQVDHETVRRWRDRWRAAEARLQAIETTGKPKLLSQAIEALLADEQRPRAVVATSHIRSLNGWGSSCLLHFSRSCSFHK